MPMDRPGGPGGRRGPGGGFDMHHGPGMGGPGMGGPGMPPPPPRRRGYCCLNGCLMPFVFVGGIIALLAFLL